MNTELVGAIGLVIMLFLMFLGIPIAVCMCLVGIVGYGILGGIPAALSLTGIVPFSVIASYSISVLPVFILLGEFAAISGMMSDAYRAANVWMRNLPGGLASASILGAALFSAVSGSSMACAAMMTQVSLPSLLKYKYNPSLATGALAAGGTLGNLIPPGIGFVFYALLSDSSLGRLYTAALIPGVMLTLMYVLQITLQCKLKPSLAPYRDENVATWKDRIFALKYTWSIVVVFLSVMGGIWFGVFTVTEAGSFGTLLAFLYAVSRKVINGRTLVQSFNNTAKICGMGFAVMVGAQIFTYFITISGLNQALAEWVVSLHLSTIGVVIIIMVIYFLLGIAMDTLSMILLTLPIFLPLLNSLNIDLIWFGVLVIIQMELSNITPPVGMNLFIVSAMVKDKGISMGMVFKGALPFCVTMLVFNALLIIFPQIALFLVNTMR